MTDIHIPHRDLIDELALTLIPINLQLPHVSALFKWLTSIQTVGDVKITHPTEWITAINPNWGFLFEEKLQGLLFLQHFINDMEQPLIKLMESLADFAPFKEVQNAIYNLQQSYSDIPYIETEVAMLSSGCNILEQKELLPTLLYYLDKVTTFVIKVEHLKETLLHTLIHSAAHSFFPPAPSPKRKFTTC
jgi:hypothetical protein